MKLADHLDDGPLSIGVLARETGCKVPTIRYYEQVGLMPPPIRSAGNQRRYGPAHVARLGFIRHARELGFPLDRVRAILALGDRPDHSCAEVDRIARDQLAAVEARIARLTALKEELERMVKQCGSGTVADCRVIDVLSHYTHDHCLHEDHGHREDAPAAG
jgi:DNA-binding transcriptional MerR regulator